MKTHRLLAVAAGLLSVLTTVPVRHGAQAQGNTAKDFVLPLVFQAAGPTIGAIQGTVDAYRAALGDPNNGNAPGPLASGRGEINLWPWRDIPDGRWISWLVSQERHLYPVGS
jgi:hypothetical protein